MAQTYSTITETSSFLHPQCGEAGSTNQSSNFGIYQVTAPNSSIQFINIHWLINLDRSASMLDICPDGKTKIDHLKHTLQNMMTYFVKLKEENVGLTQYLTVIMFDHEMETICKELVIDKELVNQKMEDIINKIEPRGATNIEAALDAAACHIKTIVSAPNYDKTHQLAHIFMSDGNVTAGNGNNAYLKEKLNVLPEIYPDFIAANTFIGFGNQHDAKLLKTLGDIPKGEYYFIDSIENAGMVYGEVLYNSLFEHLNNITIRVDNGEIYNYKTDSWETELNVPMIASGQTRTWHIQKTTIHQCENDDIASQASSSSSSSVEIIDSPTLVYLTGIEAGSDELYHSMVTATYPDTFDKSVEKYLWRQKTQEMMNKTSKFIEKNNPIEYPQRSSPLYPGSGSCKATFKKPRLSRGLQAMGHGVIPPAPPSSPKSPYRVPNNQYLDEQHCILDLAKQGGWMMVWATLDKMPHLVNAHPQPRRFNLVHHAVHQENIKALEQLLMRGADPSIKTSDMMTTQDLSKEASTIIQGAIGALLDKFKPSVPVNIKMEKEMSKEDYIKELDEFMLELKLYMSENDLNEDDFMKNLCDDIYVCTKSLTSTHNTSAMYLGMRSNSQGSERAYNVRDFTRLETESQPIAASFRGLSAHRTSDNTTTAYASRGASNMMRAVSNGM